MNTNIHILGAGLVGSLLAIFLKKKGYNVTIFERRPDMRTVDISAGKSINLAMSHRGWKALEIAGLKSEIEKISLPMYGRTIHNLDGTLGYQKYGKNNEAIYSVSRGDLNKMLMTEAQNLGCDIQFNKRCVDIDIEKNIVRFENSNEYIKSDLIIGADGAFSALRNAYLKIDRTDYQQTYLKHGYKELLIEVDEDKKWKMDHKSLHIWPRKQYMMIALPNIDGSFTVTLFLPFEGEISFEAIKNDEEILQFFNNFFPDSISLLENLIHSFQTNPTSSLVIVKTNPWIYKNKSFLIGDAAHAIVPFYGQGMNAGFEDCTVLMDIMDTTSDWSKILELYQNKRKKNGDAVADLAVRNFYEMRDWIAEPEFLERKRIEKELGKLYPDIFNSVYEMVSFSHTSYHWALQCTELQDRLLQNIMQLGNFEDLCQTQRNTLDKLLDSYKIELDKLEK